MSVKGLVVMAYGTPSTREDVETYYTRIRHGRAPSPEQLSDLVRRYDAIGGTSPLAQRTADQVSALAARLEREHPGAFEVRFGSKYEPPLLEEAAAPFREDAECVRWLGYPAPPDRRRIAVFCDAYGIAVPRDVAACVAGQQRMVAMTCEELS